MIKCQFCGYRKFSLKFHYKKKPPKETNFKIKKKDYERFYVRCKNCSHLYSLMYFNLDNLYTKNYSKFTYGKKIFRTFTKIKNLPKHKSDNFFRVKRFINFCDKNRIKNKKFLDIGSGTGIFPYELNKKNIDIRCIEKDLNFRKHLKENLSLRVIKDNYNNRKFRSKFNVISINKVLEHVEKPNDFLKKISNFLCKGGYIYFEVPDAELASKINKNREELFVEHIHGFSKKSTKLLFKLNYFSIIKIKSIIEPSGKYTIYGFAKKT